MSQPLWPQQIWECQSADCGLRFPVVKDEPRAKVCPLCDTTTLFVEQFERPPANQPKKLARSTELTFVLDNIRSANNVGSMIRTADAVGASVMLGGFTATPENPKVVKTALGADESVSWSDSRNTLRAIIELQESGTIVWALEATPTSVDLTSIDIPDGPLAIVVGNEVSGVDPGILRQVSTHVHLPMIGIKTSLNVAVAMGAAAYLLGKKLEHG